MFKVMFIILTNYAGEGLLESTVPDQCDYREIRAHLRLNLAKMSLNRKKTVYSMFRYLLGYPVNYSSLTCYLSSYSNTRIISNLTKLLDQNYWEFFFSIYRYSFEIHINRSHSGNSHILPQPTM